MRLIDADELLERMKGMNMLFSPKIVIDNMPTIYNVDNVVEELEENKKKSILFQHEAELQGSIVNDNYFGGKRNAYADAIEIVKRGGLNV